MLRFSWNMWIADSKRNLRGGWWFGILFLISIGILPFLMEPMSYMYIVIMSLMLFQPQFSRIYFVVPLDEKKIKQIFLYRIAIVCGIILGSAAIFLLASYVLSNPIEETGWGVISFEISIFMVCSETSLEGFRKEPKQFRPRYILAALFIIIDAISFAFFNEIDAKWNFAINVLVLLLAFCYMLCYLRNLTFGDYVYVPAFYGNREKVERK